VWWQNILSSGKEITRFKGTPKSVAFFTTGRHWFLSWASRVLSILPRLTFVTSFWVLVPPPGDPFNFRFAKMKGLRF
jgi:hypothetical protein